MVSVDVKHHAYLLTCVTKSDRVWRKMPESDARSVGCMVYAERAEMAAVSSGTSHVTTKTRCMQLHHLGGYSKRAVKSQSPVESHMQQERSASIVC